MKNLAEESRMSVLPRICSLNVLPAFPLAISWLPVDILRELMEAGIMLDFIKLIRIALKTGTPRL